MRWVTILLILMVSACATPPPPAPQVVPFQSAPVTAVPQPVPPKVATVTQAYRGMAQKEVSAVTSPAATPASVRSVHDADIQARQALRILESQGRHPTEAALSNAREAVRGLADILDKSP